MAKKTAEPEGSSIGWVPQDYHDAVESELKQERRDHVEANEDFWSLVSLMDPNAYLRWIATGPFVPQAEKRRRFLKDLRAKQEREKFEAMKQLEKLDYLLEKTLEK